MITEQNILNQLSHLANRRSVGDLSCRLDSLKHAAYQYQVSHCVHQHDLPVCDCYGNQRVISVPCGKCYHCRSTLQNEWVTRMYYETKAHKYCYFISLDYKPFKRLQDIPEQLRNAYYMRDRHNFRGSDGYHPTLLRIEHFQMFIKHLRDDARSAGKDFKSLTYYATGELGKRFGRPHFHIVLWSDYPVTLQDVYKAWSTRSGRKHMVSVPIGYHIDFNDLNANGTLSGSAMLDGKKRSARFCFKYVCKYVNKAETANLTRLQMAYDSIQSLKTYYHEFYVKHANSLELTTDRLSDLKMALDVCSGKRISQRLTDVRYPEFHRFMQESYNAHRIDNDDCMIYENYINYEKYPNLPNIEKMFDLSFEEFSRLFRPFTTCSRARGIGSNWLHPDNIQRVVNGNKAFEDCPLGELVMPRYYLRKISEVVQPYRFSTPSGQTTRPHIAFNKGVYEVSMQAFEGVLYRGSLQIDVDCISVDDAKVLSLSRKDFGPGVIKRLDCGRVLVPYYIHEYDAVHFVQFRYNRSTRSYLFDALVSALDVVSGLNSSFHLDYLRYLEVKRRADERSTALNRISDLCKELDNLSTTNLWYADCDGISFEGLLQDANVNAEAERVARQAAYEKEYAQRKHKPNF